MEKVSSGGNWLSQVHLKTSVCDTCVCVYQRENGYGHKKLKTNKLLKYFMH